MSRLLLCVTAGRGPAECRAAVAHVLETMTREATSLGLACAVEADLDGDKASVLLSLDGEAATHFAKLWTGSVQVIAKSQLRAHHKRKNWFVGVHLMAPPAQTIAVLESDVVFDVFRAGGPGGQHQNRTESAVRATHRPSGASAIAREARSQHRNRAVALARLTDLLSGVAEREANRCAFEAWARKIDVQRGAPVRVLKSG